MLPVAQMLLLSAAGVDLSALFPLPRAGPLLCFVSLEPSPDRAHNPSRACSVCRNPVPRIFLAGDSVLGWRCPRGSCRTPGQGKGPVAHTLGLGPSEISKRLHNLGDNGPATSLALKAPFKWKVSSSLLRCPPILSFLSLHLRGPVVLGGAEGRWVKGCTTHTPSSWSRHLALVLRTLMSEQVRSSPGFSSFRRQ